MIRLKHLETYTLEMNCCSNFAQGRMQTSFVIAEQEKSNTIHPANYRYIMAPGIPYSIIHLLSKCL